MKYKVDGVLKFYASTKLKLDLEFASPTGAQITLNPTNDNDLAIGIRLEANSETVAKEMAELELERVSNLLSYFQDIPISGSRIKEIASESPTSLGNKSVALAEYAHVIDSVSVVKEFDTNSLAQLRQGLEEKEYPQDFEDVISMWRKAISTEASALKYLLLYRLMEFLFKDTNRVTKNLTDWIKKKEPSVHMFSNRHRKGDFTVYTYLRDNIHPKQEQRDFPLQDINNLLPKFQNLVKEAIKEKFGYPNA